MRTKSADAKEAARQLEKAAAWLEKWDPEDQFILELGDKVKQLRTSMSRED